MSAVMRFDPEAFLAHLWALDELLSSQRRPFHVMSPWWRDVWTQVFRAMARPNRRLRRLVARAGRRSGKSSTLARICVAWFRWGTWHVPAGDIAVIAFLSISKDEASRRLRTITEILDVLGEPYVERADEVETTGARRCLFKVFAASSKLAVGFTAILIVCDEVARWEARESAAEPAPEVVGSIAPSLATQPFGLLVLSSSPWSLDDYHAQMFDRGTSDDQLVVYAPSWIANPSLTEESTRAEEPDERIWQREYLAIPGQTLTAALDADDLAACFRPVPAISTPFVAIDASSLRNDAFAWIAGGTSRAGELVVRDVGGWDGAALRRVSMEDIVSTLSTRAKQIGTKVVFGDQREEAALRSLFGQHGVSLRSFAWSEPSKDSAMQLLRRLMRERRLVLVEHDAMKRELRNIKARLLPSGRISYATNGADYASALITLAHALVDRAYFIETDSTERNTLGRHRSPRAISGSRGW